MRIAAAQRVVAGGLLCYVLRRFELLRLELQCFVLRCLELRRLELLLRLFVILNLNPLASYE